MSNKVEANKIVTLSYILRDDHGEIIDQSDEGQPLVYLHGARNIVPGLEEQLEGVGEGERTSPSLLLSRHVALLDVEPADPVIQASADARERRARKAWSVSSRPSVRSTSR